MGRLLYVLPHLLITPSPEAPERRNKLELILTIRKYSL